MFPRVLRAGLVVVDPATAAVRRVIALQYNPDTLTRSVAVQAAGTDPSQALRLKGVAVETFRLEAVIDATDRLEHPEDHPETVQFGIQPDVALLHSLVNPTVAQLTTNQRLAASGLLEVLPETAPLVLFVWSRERVLPVRITELTIAEEAFDPRLNPLRAKVTLALRSLTVDDLGLAGKPGSLALAYVESLERLAARTRSADLATLGLAVI